MENESTKTGLIGFFDILGYQNLLERNEPETIAEEVIPILSNIGEMVTNSLTDFHKAIANTGISETSIERNEKIIGALRWLVFSDTVLLTLPIEDIDPDVVNIPWFIFLVAAIFLQNSLFKAGLPTRGAIDHGKFFIQDTCFAGRTIVTAYQLCSQIELAACVFSECAANEFSRCQGYDSLYDSFVVEYLVPMKSGERHLLTTMAPTFNQDSPDIHAEVMGAFWGNRKDISLSARQKAQNTEQWLEFLLYREKKK
jgi:hypothetical protein